MPHFLPPRFIRVRLIHSAHGLVILIYNSYYFRNAFERIVIAAIPDLARPYLRHGVQFSRVDPRIDKGFAFGIRTADIDAECMAIPFSIVRTLLYLTIKNESACIFHTASSGRIFYFESNLGKSEKFRVPQTTCRCFPAHFHLGESHRIRTIGMIFKKKSHLFSILRIEFRMGAWLFFEEMNVRIRGGLEWSDTPLSVYPYRLKTDFLPAIKNFAPEGIVF